MQLIALLLLTLIGVFLLRHRLAGQSRLLAGRLKKIAWVAAFIAVLLLLASGRLTVLLAAIGAALIYCIRVLPILLSHAPSLQRLWQATQNQKSQPGPQPAPNTGTMTPAEAYQVLGLKPGASRQEIITAHRKLMQKNHPDHGGSDYLAAKINLAKTILVTR